MTQATAPAKYPAHGEPCAGPPPWCQPAYVIISRIEGDNAPRGVVECSFSMDRDPDRINIWVSMKRARSIIVDALAGKPIEWEVDGKRDSEAYAARDKGVNETLEVWNAEDPDLPIIIDWTQWWADNAPNEHTLSGVTNKFKSRNAPFAIKEQR